LARQGCRPDAIQLHQPSTASKPNQAMAKEVMVAMCFVSAEIMKMKQMANVFFGWKALITCIVSKK
jgi:hypothetical protein